MNQPLKRCGRQGWTRILVFAVWLGLAFSAFAGSGALDPTFGVRGKAFVAFSARLAPSPPTWVGVTGMALQPDGKIIAVGNSAISLVRTHADGTLDTAFGAEGGVFLEAGFSAQVVALQPDGRIVLAGSNGSSPALLRYNADGSRDSTFGDGGRAILDVRDADSVYALSLQSDGKILAAGGWPNAMFLIRVDGDGRRDGGFGVNGLLRTQIRAAGIGQSIATLPDGRIVIAGEMVNAVKAGFSVARFLPDGSPDASFNSTGISHASFGGTALQWAYLIAVQADGRIVAAGTTEYGTRVGLVRFKPDGSLDESFNGSGLVSVSLRAAFTQVPRALAVQADGSIIVSGYTEEAGVERLLIARYKASGEVDPTFDVEAVGAAVTSNARAGALALLADGSVVVGGYSDSTVAEFLLARCRVDGRMDATFGNQGQVKIVVQGLDDTPSELAVLDSGRIILAGAGSGAPDGLAWLKADGSPDLALNGSGIAASSGSDGTLVDAVVHPDGRLTVLEASWFSTPRVPASVQVFLRRRLETGALDPTFAGTLVSSTGALLPHGLVLQPDGKVIVIRHPSESPRRIVLHRAHADGSIDSAFGAASLVTAPGAASPIVAILQGDGRLMVIDSGDEQPLMIRYNPDGSLDGLRPVDLVPGIKVTVRAAVLGSDGKILIAGSAGSQALVARLSPDGVPEQSFGVGGTALFPGAPIVGLALQPDGKILALSRNWELVRLQSGGAFDPAFGMDGRLTIPAGGTATAIVRQSDGRILAAGSGYGRRGLEFKRDADYLVARLDADASSSPGLAATLTRLDFGGQSMNTTSRKLSVKVVNNGATTRKMGSVLVQGPFEQTNDCSSLAPGASCTISVVFKPALSIFFTNIDPYQPVFSNLVIASDTEDVAVGLSGMPEKSLVTHYYQSILRRVPDSAGKEFWAAEAARVAGLGANLNETWFAMAMSFYGSAEYLALARNPTEFVRDLYNTFFNRTADNDGLAFWTGRIASGMPREVALASFMFSVEFNQFAQNIFGNTAARAEVDTVVDFYRGLLSRLPDSEGFGFWVGRFRVAQCQGAPSVYTQVEAISTAYANSGEYTARERSNAQYVGDLYNAFLRRGGDLEGVKFWIGQLDSGAQTRDQLRKAFTGSPEFSARVNAIIAQGCSQ